MNRRLMLPLLHPPGAGTGIGFWASRHQTGEALHAGYFIGNLQHGGPGAPAMTPWPLIPSRSSFIGGPGCRHLGIRPRLGAAGDDPAAPPSGSPWRVLGKKFRHHRPPGQRGDHQRARQCSWARFTRAGRWSCWFPVTIISPSSPPWWCSSSAAPIPARNGDRPQLSAALPVCQLRAAPTVIGGFRTRDDEDAYSHCCDAHRHWRPVVSISSPVTGCQILSTSSGDESQAGEPHGTGDQRQPLLWPGCWSASGVSGLAHSALRCIWLPGQQGAAPGASSSAPSSAPC